jgi:hypothetical protein
MEPWLAWTVLIMLFVAPLVHVTISPRGGPFRPPPGARCPLGPRLGWIVIVLLLGPIGWLMYMRRRRARP